MGGYNSITLTNSNILSHVITSYSIHYTKLYDKKYKKVNIEVVTDQMATMPKTVKADRYLLNAAVSPDGKRVLAEARGEIFSLPAEKGFVLNLTQSSGSAQRYPAWSPVITSYSIHYTKLYEGAFGHPQRFVYFLYRTRFHIT